MHDELAEYLNIFLKSVTMGMDVPSFNFRSGIFACGIPAILNDVALVYLCKSYYDEFMIGLLEI